MATLDEIHSFRNTSLISEAEKLGECKQRSFVAAGSSILPMLVLPFVNAQDLRMFSTYLIQDHAISESLLETQLRIADYVDLETEIIQTLHELKSLPSLADRKPLLEELDFPNRLDRYLAQNASLNRIEQSDLMLSFYGLYESPFLGGIRMFLLPDVTRKDQNHEGPSYGQLVVLFFRRPKSVGRFTVTKNCGRLIVTRTDCKVNFKLLWNEEMQAFDLQVNERVVLRRRTSCFSQLKNP